MGASYSTPKVGSVHYTAELVAGLPDQRGKVHVITGTSIGGLGFTVAQALLERGARVVCLNRDVSKSQSLKGDVVHVTADLMSFDSVRAACATVRKSVTTIDCLLLNAGVMMLPDHKSADGFDVQMATNHLAHFLITKELSPLLAPDARIVTQSSEARNGPPAADLQERFFERDAPPGRLGNNLGLGRMQRYQQSKLANAVFTYALRDRLSARGSAVKALLVHPGICASNLASTAADSEGSTGAFKWLTKLIMTQAQSAEDGALPMILAATQPDPPVFSGPNEGLALLGLNYIRGYPRELQPEPYCVSARNKDLLWAKSCEAVGVRDDWLSDDPEVVTVLDTSCRVIDLGHALDKDTLFWPGGEGLSLCVQTSGSNAAGDFYAAGSFSCAEHGGTHVDAPFHFDETGRTVDRLPLSELVGRCRVVRTFALDCADQEVSAASASASPEQRNGTVAAILAHEAEHGLIPAGAVVCFHTGWGPRYSQGRLAYLGWDGPASAYDAATTALSFPGVEPEAARLLLKRGVSAVGIDTASLDPGSSKDFETHRVLLSAGVFGIENLSAELARVPAKGATVAALPLRLAGGSGAPARVVAFCPKT